MSVFSTARFTLHDWRGGSHLLPIALATALAGGAAALVAYLLWPTYDIEGLSNPDRLPVSVGGTLFNVPSSAVRMKIQRHSGPQKPVDLSFDLAVLQLPDPHRHGSMNEVDAMTPPIDHIFLSIAAHRDLLAPEMRVRTIYPRYLEGTPPAREDGLSMRPFREGTPYAGEDLFIASAPGLTARCTRDAATPGMCL